MNVTTIAIGQEEALRKLAQYRGLNKKQIQPEDERLARLYRMVSKGARVVDVNEAFRATGLNEAGWPKLGLARADWTDVFYRHNWHWNQGHDGGGSFGEKRDSWGRSNRIRFTIPAGTFAIDSQGGRATANGIMTTPVPHIPPNIRPEIALSNFHILFEVEEWKQPATPVRYNRDPFLLRHIAGGLYVVVAEWDLTPLEASLLGSMRNGN